MQRAEVRTNSMSHSLPDENDFSLAIGGPLYQFYLRTKLARPALQLVGRRAVCLSLFCWLPLLILTLIEGNAFGGVSVPFLLDIGVHVRFLLALPILIIAELIVHERSRSIVRQFVTRGIVQEDERARFEHIVGSTLKLRDSVLVEVVLAAFVLLLGYMAWTQNLTLNMSTWFSASTNTPRSLTAAGYWFLFVSSAILRFVILRWYFRIILWYQLLWRVRGLELHLDILHPDRAAGLGFLEESVLGFAPVMFGQTLLLAGVIGSRIWHAGAVLTDFEMEMAFAVIFFILLVLAPLCFFAVQLEHAARTAKREYGLLSAQYVEDFRNKWIKKEAGNEPLLGTPDIQSLSDLGNAYEVVKHMRLFPFSKESVITLAVFIILPLLPLTLTMVPLGTIIERIIKFVL